MSFFALGGFNLTTIKIHEKIILDIYSKIYTKIIESQTTIFLCGGVKTNPSYIRDDVRKLALKKIGINILYPEDMFIEMLEKDKSSDLLSYEKFLADNCDCICIICESPGSLVELGAFINNDVTMPKVIALLEESRKKDKSFIMLGPIKYLTKKTHKDNVIFYNKDDLVTLSEKLVTKAKTYKKNYGNYGINTIIGVVQYLPLLLYFHKSLTYQEIKECLDIIWDKYKLCVLEKDTLMNASLKLLFKNRTIFKENVSNRSFYGLTKSGYELVYTKLYYSTNRKNRKCNSKLYDSIRFDIINKSLYDK